MDGQHVALCKKLFLCHRLHAVLGGFLGGEVGLARTGRVVAGAALLMAVTFASLMAADVSVMRIFGVGVPLAVLVDATLVRMLLMPAFMRVLGPVNWWAPRPLARLHQRVGISESPDLAVPLRPAAAYSVHDGLRPEPSVAVS